MKKYLLLLITILLTLTFVACNTGLTTTQTTTTTTDSSTTTQTTTSETTTQLTTTKKTFKTDTSVVNYQGSYCDDLTVNYEFIDNLLAGLTLDEKIGQMIQAERNGLSATDVSDYNLGSILSGGGSAPSVNAPYNWYLMYKNYQDGMRTSSSGIPVIYGVDAVHGHNNVLNATIFPHNIGLGAANDPELMTKVGLVTAREVRVSGLNYTFAPTVAVVQNIGWGRTYESLSENTDIVTSLSSAYIEGLQSYCVG